MPFKLYYLFHSPTPLCLAHSVNNSTLHSSRNMTSIISFSKLIWVFRKYFLIFFIIPRCSISSPFVYSHFYAIFRYKLLLIITLLPCLVIYDKLFSYKVLLSIPLHSATHSPSSFYYYKSSTPSRTESLSFVHTSIFPLFPINPFPF